MKKIVIIGGYGSAGVKVANDIAKNLSSNHQLILIDDGDPGGGLCILRGCMPSKEVLSAGAHKYQSRSDSRINGDIEVDLNAVVDRKNKNIEDFAKHRRESVHKLAERDNIDFIHDTAEFIDNHTIKTGDRTIEADYIVIATGSTPNIPDIHGINNVDYMTSDDVLNCRSFPSSGIAIGFGYIGVELAPYLSEAGNMDLTIIDRNKRPLGYTDPEFGERLLDLYKKEFDINIINGAEAKSVDSIGNQIEVEFEKNGKKETEKGEQLFLFTGRKPNVSNLKLENTNINVESDWVKDTMQTKSDPKIYAAGDVNKRRELLHIAKEEGAVVAENILSDINGEKLKRFNSINHFIVFSGLSVYPFACLGLTEKEAKKKDIDYKSATREASNDGVFKTKDVPYGLAKLIVREDGRVLGYQGLHYHADVMAKTMQIIIKQKQNIWDIPDRAYHPTTPEIIDGLLQDIKQKIS